MSAPEKRTRTDLAASSEQRFGRVAASLVLIVLVALGVRWIFAWSQTRKIPREALAIVPFQTETGHIAYSLVTGRGYASPFQRDTGPTAWLAPVYPLLVAGIFKVFGTYGTASFFAAISLNIFCSSVACVPLYFAGKRVAGVGVGRLAAWSWALFPNAVMIPFEWIWDTSLAALFAATLLWATLVLAASSRWRAWCAYGLVWGLTLMTNPALASLFPPLLAWLAYRMRREGRFSFSRPAAALSLALLCCLPWTVRNYIAFHRFIPFRSNLPYELYIGNNENYEERRRGLPPVIKQDFETLRYLRMGETAFLDEEWRKAWRFISSHPRVELWLLGNRIVDFWLGTSEPIKVFLESDSPLLRAILLVNFLVAGGTILGLAVLFLARNLYAFPLAVFPAVFPLLYYLTHASLRYRHPIDPILLLLVAIAVCGFRPFAGGRFAGLSRRGHSDIVLSPERGGAKSD